MTTPGGIGLTHVTINSPDPMALAEFYARLLGWEVAADNDPTWVPIRNPEGGIGLACQLEPIYERPVWPAAKAGEQQMQMHLEVGCTDLEAAAAHAKACGATLAEFQPNEGNLVHYDPDGHPFCLYLNT